MAPVGELDGLPIDPIADEDLDELARDLLPARLRRNGDDLEITDTDSGDQFHGIISGHQVRYEDRDDLFSSEAVFTVEGTALSEDLVALTVTREFASKEVESVVGLRAAPGAHDGCAVDVHRWG